MCFNRFFSFFFFSPHRDLNLEAPIIPPPNPLLLEPNLKDMFLECVEKCFIQNQLSVDNIKHNSILVVNNAVFCKSKPGFQEFFTRIHGGFII